MGIDFSPRFRLNLRQSFHDVIAFEFLQTLTGATFNDISPAVNAEILQRSIIQRHVASSVIYCAQMKAGFNYSAFSELEFPVNDFISFHSLSLQY